MLYDHTVCYGNIRRNAHQLPYSLHGVGWCWDVNVPLTTFPRPCRRCWCFARVGWGGVGWGGDVHVSSTTFPRPCTRFWCYTHMGRGRVGWGCSRSFNHVPSTLHKNLMLRSHGAGWRCWRSFDHVPLTLHKIFMLCSHGVWGGDVRPRSLALAQDVDAALKWVGWGGALLRFTRPFARLWCCAQDHDAQDHDPHDVDICFWNVDDNNDDDPVWLFQTRGKWLIVILL